MMNDSAFGIGKSENIRLAPILAGEPTLLENRTKLRVRLG